MNGLKFYCSQIKLNNYINNMKWQYCKWSHSQVAVAEYLGLK